MAGKAKERSTDVGDDEGEVARAEKVAKAEKAVGEGDLAAKTARASATVDVADDDDDRTRSINGLRVKPTIKYRDL